MPIKTDEAADLVAQGLQLQAENRCKERFDTHIAAVEKEIGALTPEYRGLLEDLYGLGFQEGWGFGIEKFA